MKTTLIYAGIAGYGFDSLGKGMEAGWINHGLAQLSACAKAEGFDVDLIDLRGLKGWDEFRAELEQRRPDVEQQHSRVRRTGPREFFLFDSSIFKSSIIPFASNVQLRCSTP